MDSKLLALIASLAIISQYYVSDKTVSDFEAFKIKYGKTYASAEEEAFRYAVYLENMKKAASHNAKSGVTYTKGENQFSDLEHQEFKAIYLNMKVSQNQPRDNELVATSKPSGSINWVTKGDVQVVKNQGSCGSCWAFSAVASVECADAVFNSHLGDFSEQQVVDCDKGGSGCGGGENYQGISYLVQAGVCTEASYPYQGVNGTCGISSCTKSPWKPAGMKMVSKTVADLQAACDIQPVSIGCDASQWQSYSGGILSNCGTNIDHGILLAGYTSSYWLVKNSWGASWGLNGYIKLAGNQNTCAICDSAAVPTK